MTFYTDKKFAMKHYSVAGWFWLVLGILLVILSFIFYNFMPIVISLGIIFTILGIWGLSLGNYGNLTFFGKGFMIGRRESYGDLLFTKVNTYIYDITKIDNISIFQKFITIKGIFIKSKYFGKPEYFEDKLHKQHKQINIVKIPRIYEKENELLLELNKFLNKQIFKEANYETRIF